MNSRYESTWRSDETRLYYRWEEYDDSVPTGTSTGSGKKNWRVAVFLIKNDQAEYHRK